MASNSLGTQLERIGWLPALAVVLAAALATFAVLDRAFPISPSSAAAPSVQAPAHVAPVSSIPSAGSTSSSDPLAASYQSFEKSQQKAAKRALATARAHTARLSKALIASRAPTHSTTLRVVRASTGASAGPSAPVQAGGQTRPNGGASVNGAHNH